MSKKQTFAVASTSVLAAGMAQGAIVYSGNISSELSGASAYLIDLDQDFTFDYTVRFDGINGDNQLKPFIDARKVGNPNAWILSKTNTGAPLTLFGTQIDASYAEEFPTNKVGYLYQQYDNGTVVGDWPSTADTEGYVGLAITDGVTATNYGWAHLIYKASSDPKTLVMVDFAYETTPDTGIIAGAIATPAEPIIYENPASQTVGAGSAVEMKVTALADPAPTYQWIAGPVGSGNYTNLLDDGHFSGTTSSSLSIDNVTPDDQLDYVVVVSNNLGSATSSPPATLTVQQAIISGPIPAEAHLFAGQTARFSIKLVSGASQEFQWRKDGIPLPDGGNISGATSSNLVISGVTAGDAGNYDVVLNTSFGSLTSSIAPLSILAPSGAFESALLAQSPVSYYPLNETTDPSSGTAIAYDYTGGNNGVYGLAAWNGNPNYNIAGPTPDLGFPGFSGDNKAVSTFVNLDNSNVKLAPWNLNTNTITITAWIYPQGNQARGAGVVYTRSTNDMVAGLAYYDTFGGTNYTLGYNWNDQPFAYFWRSGLEVPENQWSFVALVITPTNAVVYSFHDSVMSSATNEATHVVQSFGDFVYIGTDPQGAPGSHNFNGTVDEVAVFNRSLSAADLQALYGSANGAVSLNISRSDEGVQLTWPFGTLLESTSLLGPWTTNTATSPYVLPPDAPQKFFRVITK